MAYRVQYCEIDESSYVDSAIREFERTIELDLYWGLNHANLGALYRAGSDLEPEWKGHPFWQSTPLCMEIISGWQDQGWVQDLEKIIYWKKAQIAAC